MNIRFLTWAHQSRNPKFAHYIRSTKCSAQNIIASFFSRRRPFHQECWHKFRTVYRFKNHACTLMKTTLVNMVSGNQTLRIGDMSCEIVIYHHNQTPSHVRGKVLSVPELSLWTSFYKLCVMRDKERWWWWFLVGTLYFQASMYFRSLGLFARHSPTDKAQYMTTCKFHLHCTILIWH